MLRPGRIESTTARLILAIGSRSGVEAPLQPGYYMIGRHHECQIRPKSRSVSRRHCLIYHDDSGLQVLDLRSAAGTYVNGKRLNPGAWEKLTDGALLRCGKVAFEASLGQRSERSVPGHEGLNAAASRADSMLAAQPWHDVDIAGFLESEDDAERENRYDNIRSKNDATNTASTTSYPPEFDAEVDAFEDDNVRDLAGDNDPVAPQEKRPKPEKKKRSGPSRMPKRHRNSKTASAGRSWMPSGNLDSLQLIGAMVITVAVVGFLGYKVYQFYSGPPVRIVENID